MTRIAQVLLPMPLPEAFDYAEPEGMGLEVGDHVVAPLGPRFAVGVVVGLRDGAGVTRPLKPVVERRDEPPLPANTLKFVQWAARYAVDWPGAPLAIALRGSRAPKPRPLRLLAATGAKPARMTPARERVLAAAASEAMPAAALAQAAQVSAGVLKALLDEGVLREKWVFEPADFPEPDLERPHRKLNPGQAAAAKALGDVVHSGFSVTLLDGVTGSGKTEIYLEAVAQVLRADRSAQVLVLLPEIALTQAVMARFEDRFGVEPAQWHSGVSPPRRRRAWEAVAAGRCRIVVGARSALYLPFQNLKLIVVDEEHDASYKQEEGFIYHARDLAVARAKIEDAPVVLASATPSLETLHNAQSGRYGWLRLADRHGGARLPEIDLVDLRETPPDTGKWLSPPLVKALAETYGRGEQSLLFLNRRGYAPLVLCKACGEKLTAPDTDSWLVEHRYTGRLVCHLTGFSMAKPKTCPHCGAEGSLVSIGPGVERSEAEGRER
ncbi:MAG TPA: primosomal protein N', partial [Caulobacteraceae bacterium]|nr:primosomal protein N' [Caulobacteraceae bacterium]